MRGEIDSHTEEQHLQSGANITRHTERKRKYPVTNTKELSCKKDNYIEINNQLDCFGSKEPHNDVFRHSECNEESHSCCNLRGYFAHAQYDVKEHNVGYKREKTAFTLAEVLITLGIIGVVAAITMPILLNNVESQVQAKRIENIRQKLSKVTDKMAVQSGLIGYDDTSAFIQEMQKHMKIAKVCDNNHLDACWPTKEVVLNDEGKTWEISKTKNAKTLKIPKEMQPNWSDTIGIVTADGTSMILSYDKTCDFDVDKYGLKSDGTISNSANCLSGVYDWNGGKKPNKLGKDIRTLGMATGLGTECAIEIGDRCFTAPFVPKPLTSADCLAQKNTLGINHCLTLGDYWAGAVRQCNGVQNMPTAEDLANLASELYGIDISAEERRSNIKLDTQKATSIGFSVASNGFVVWTGEEYNSGGKTAAFIRTFGASSTLWIQGGRYSSSTIQAVCLGD